MKFKLDPHDPSVSFGHLSFAEIICQTRPSSADVERLPLLMSGAETVMPFAEGRTVTGVSVSVGASRPAHGYPVLLGDGDRMLVPSDGGKALRIMETRPGAPALAPAKTLGTPTSEDQPFVTDEAETLMADVSDSNKCTVRALPSLRRISQFDVSAPPDDATREPDTASIRLRGLAPRPRERVATSASATSRGSDHGVAGGADRRR
ncbi:hypothetical protein OKJ48_20520 [Streptomyces kunmingensis]|uniref:Uncharacterized protein n=1 Tax=Streptomyces kunmingensis TaxID=68225 RepID=A0ABU6CD34_9ACTN|nr:hypothetical protein [Streptomyces kunmingensis]MEB3962617.1 hypothetical protein [Streptomyces kunmingensis]